MRKFLVLLSSAGLLAAAAIAITPISAAASAPSDCTWSIEAQNNGQSVQFWSEEKQVWDWLNTAITTYVGDWSLSGCAKWKFYASYQWTTNHTSGTYETSVRVWSCGTYIGQWVAGGGTIVWSDAVYYSDIFCGRQADNDYHGYTWFQPYIGSIQYSYATAG